MSFNELRLAEPIVRAVTAEGYTTPTPIQTQAIPVILTGHDLFGCAQTGTGKTGAFALPILHRLSGTVASNGRENQNGRHGKNQSRGGRPRVLVLAPTRELATQIHESFRTYGRYLRLQHAVVFGGVSQSGQVRQLRAGVDVLVATPGRLLDLINQGYIDLGGIETLVLDEADRMLDMGFINDIRKVVERMPARRQTLLFSATMPAEIRRLADSILRDPITLKVTPEATTVDAIHQSVYLVVKKNKPILLERLLRKNGMARTLVFTRTKHGADKLVKILRRADINADAIHGNKNQNARTRALDGFKKGRTSVLVATDIASRGIDVDEITHVVNFDIPYDAESYVHRIGRTARAGASGVALSFCDHEELKDLKAIERLIRLKLEVLENEPDLVYTESPAHWEKRGQPATRNAPAGGSRSQRSRSRGGRSRQAASSGPSGRGRSRRYA